MHRSGELARLTAAARAAEFTLDALSLAATGLALAALAAAHLARRRRPVYLMSFAVYKPPAAQRGTRAGVLRKIREDGASEEAYDFHRRMLERGGLGDATYFPKGMKRADAGLPIGVAMEDAREEAREVLFAVAAEALAKAGLRPQQVDAIVVNCSLFNPTPSLAAMVR
jgi:3-ketoacyl-CoA synthase